MTGAAAHDRAADWEAATRAWRDPAEVIMQRSGLPEVDPDLLKLRTRGDWWGVLAELGVTLLVTREYEHLAISLAAPEGKPATRHLVLPHPSGVAVDQERGLVHVAATRNPNQVFTLAPASGALTRSDAEPSNIAGNPLVPVASRFLPGATYIHDLAMVGGVLHANAVGMNAVAALADGARERVVWWPKSIERSGRPDFGRNYLQLNSIAAGRTIEESFFSASGPKPGRRRPGHRDYPVDGRGVIFSGTTREPIAGGLTRPHSARLHDGQLWVDNSGYGTLARIADGNPEVVAVLPGWTRGLAFHGDVAFVGTSHVIPRFRQYAPGLDPAKTSCGVHAVDTTSGRILASASWPSGNQIFGIECVPAAVTHGFPFGGPRRAAEQLRRLFYSFDYPDRRTQ